MDHAMQARVERVPFSITFADRFPVAETY